MKTRTPFVLAALALMGIAIFGVFGISSRWHFSEKTAAQQAPIQEGSLRWYAAQAAQHGETTITLMTQPHYSAVGDLNTAISDYSLIVGQLVARSTAQDESGNSITTWYKFRVSERLTQRPFAACSYCSAQAPPSDLLPLQQGEILLPLMGGSLYIDNVIVDIRLSGFSDFVTGQNYLLFLNFDDSNNIGILSLGPRGALLLTSQNTFTPVVAIPTGQTEIISNGLATQYGNSLTQLRAALNPPQPTTCDPVKQQDCYNREGEWNSDDCTCYIDPCIRRPWLCGNTY